MRDDPVKPFEKLSEAERKEIEEAVAYVGRITRRAREGMPQNAPKCPEMPRENVNRRNEPKPIPASTPQCPKMSHPAPKCPTPNLEVQNEPTDAQSAIAKRSRPLSPRQLTAISAMYAGHSLSEIARHLRVDRKTLFRWRRRPDFVAEINERYAQQMRPRPGTTSSPSTPGEAGLPGSYNRSTRNAACSEPSPCPLPAYREREKGAPPADPVT